ncbi:MAG: hypothetical protein U0271_38785 [Polyangiaceae bacterium]
MGNVAFVVRSGLAGLVLGVVGVVAACGDSTGGVGNDGEVVGGACETASDCADGSRCVIDGSFPDGVCTVACSSDADCPEDSVCISTSGGICLLPCDTNDECRPGYVCDQKSREGADGDLRVCNG